jgi:hypothetical protein
VFDVMSSESRRASIITLAIRTPGSVILDELSMIHPLGLGK